MATTAKISPRKRISYRLLPEEVVTQCIARVPLSSQGAMSLLSKKIGIFINGGEIFYTRSFLGIKETSVLVGIQSQENGSVVDWYALSKKFCNDDYVLRRVPFPLISGKETLVAAGNRVFVFGPSDFFSVEGGTYKKKTVSKTKAIHHEPITAVVDDKVYVFGGCSSDDALNYLETLDLGTNKWETLPIPEQDRELIPCNSDRVVWNGIIHFISRDKCVVFDPKTGKLERKDHASMGERMYLTSCVINNIIYTVGWNSKIEYFDSESRTWRVVRGIKPLPEFGLFNFNGKLMVLHKQRQKEIWFTLIILEKKELDMWGCVESCNCGLILEKPAEILQLLSVEI
ncbi:hypothetical protein Bca101_044566 [Brassica carinata]